MSTQLTVKDELVNLPLPIPQCIDIAYKTMQGKLIGADDIAVYLNIPVSKALEVVLSPVFGLLVHNLAIANARVSFDAIAFNQLIYISQFSPDEKTRISAIKTLADITGLNTSRNSKHVTEVNVNFDTMVRNNDKTPFPGF